MITILPSVLEKTETYFTARVKLIEPSCQLAHLDVLDHTFIPFRSFYDPAFIESLQTPLRFQVHLMTAPTAESLAVWNKPWVEKILIHLKAVEQPLAMAELIRGMGKQPGLVLDPEASLLEAKPYLAGFSSVLIMGVTPGRSGQTLIPAMVDKVKRLRAIAPDITIGFDGGITDETIAGVARAGANEIVVGSYLTADDFSQRLTHLTELANAKN